MSSSLSKPVATAIVVPFREDFTGKRREQLEIFLRYYLESSYLPEQHEVIVVEQSEDSRKFNRGAVLNVGLVHAAGRGFSAAITHDVDLLSSAELMPHYSTPVEHGTLHHIAAAWDRYGSNPKYFGGIVAGSLATWRKVNGYPNHFWGWGGEDDALAIRASNLGVKITKAERGTIVDQEKLDLHSKLSALRANMAKNMRKWEDLECDKMASMSRGMNSVMWRERSRTRKERLDHLVVELA